jgi:hypothetical protein
MVVYIMSVCTVVVVIVDVTVIQEMAAEVLKYGLLRY